MKEIAGEERRKNEHSQMEIGSKKKKEKHTLEGCLHTESANNKALTNWR